VVWDGTVSWQIYDDYFIYTATGFDADAETSPYILINETFGFIPSQYSMYVNRTAGATNAVNVRLRHVDQFNKSGVTSITVEDSRGTTYIKSSGTNYGGTSKLSEILISKFRIVITTVGLGNTLTVTLIGRR